MDKMEYKAGLESRRIYGRRLNRQTTTKLVAREYGLEVLVASGLFQMYRYGLDWGQFRHWLITQDGGFLKLRHSHMNLRVSAEMELTFRIKDKEAVKHFFHRIPVPERIG